MGTLKPGATYIYEYADGITYAREFGAKSNERFEVGRSEGRNDLDEHELVISMRRAARTNKAVRKALDRAILVYKMSEEYERENRTKR